MAAEDAALLRSNTAALAAVDPSLAAAIGGSVPAGGMDREQSRAGPMVPVALRGGSRVYLHSPYDPKREATRLAGSVGGAGCVVVIGLGGGFHVEAVRSHPETGTILVVEKDCATLRTLLSLVDLRPLLADPRVVLAAGTEALSVTLTASWQPALHGGLESLVLPSLRTVDPGFCRQAEDALRGAVENVRADYSVQAHFGKRWFLNMARNLSAAARSPSLPGPVAEATITAAGPSLEPALSRLSRTPGDFIVATDTSLPALVRAGITPAAVLSIDCQVYSYHHFLQGIPAPSVLVLDLASPPVVARGRSPVFVAGSHPFARWLARNWRPLPWIDTSGGNVTHGAASLALLLGARRITIAGADFGYPGGKPYSRGTYVYDVFGCAAGRRSPLERQVYDFVHRGADLSREERSGTSRYTTPLLRAYAGRLQGFLAASGVQVAVRPGEGLPFPADASASIQTPASQHIAPVRSPCGWKQILDRYATEVVNLPRMTDPAWSSFSSLGREQRELWQTLFPVAAAIERAAREVGAARRSVAAHPSTPQGPGPGGESGPDTPAGILELARTWVAERARQAAAAGPVD